MGEGGEKEIAPSVERGGSGSGVSKRVVGEGGGGMKGRGKGGGDTRRRGGATVKCGKMGKRGKGGRRKKGGKGRAGLEGETEMTSTKKRKRFWGEEKEEHAKSPGIGGTMRGEEKGKSKDGKRVYKKKC